MPHIQKKYILPNQNEYEIGYCGRYGRLGEKRAERKKPTAEQIAKQNQKNKENRTRRDIAANFEEGDYFITLKYPKGTRKPLEEVKKDIKNFFDKLRRSYRKYSKELKYIYRLEIGKQGGIHIHVVINRINEIQTDLLIQSKWKHGRVNFQTIYEQGGYRQLANYITKKPEEGSDEYEQLELFEKEERRKLISINSSRNLIRVEPEVKEYTRRNVYKLVTEGPKATEGYYIDKDSIVMGTNPYTGMNYIHYTEIKIKKRRRGNDNNVYQGFSN